ncbi:MAG: L-threonine 3-dehydrogenase [Paenibacillaceae bacterium]|nr:L-threonine 3-dehydrogenase [Paenibacillaceae bacterium]
MKAAVLERLEQMTIKEVEAPAVPDDGILMKVHAVGICGSDIRIYHHGNSRVTLPQILGHEAAGQIVAVGKSVNKFQVGDRISLGADVPCGECVFCEAGIGNNCQINYAMGYQYPGSFAEYVLLNKMVVNFGPIHKIADHIPYEEAALAEPLACVLNGLELSDVKIGDTVVVLGAGPIGCPRHPRAAFPAAPGNRPRLRRRGRIHLLQRGRRNQAGVGGNRRFGRRRCHNVQPISGSAG